MKTQQPDAARRYVAVTDSDAIAAIDAGELIGAKIDGAWWSYPALLRKWRREQLAQSGT